MKVYLYKQYIFIYIWRSPKTKWFILQPCFGGGMDPGYGNKWPGMDCNEIISKMGFLMGPPGGSSRQRIPAEASR